MIFFVRYLNTDELSLSEYACTSEMQDKFTQVQQSFEVLGFTAEVVLVCKFIVNRSYYKLSLT